MDEYACGLFGRQINIAISHIALKGDLFAWIFGRIVPKDVLYFPVFCQTSFDRGALIKKTLTYKEIEMGSGAMSYIRKGFPINEEFIFNYIYEEALSHPYMTLHPIPLNFFVYEENFILFFISVPY
jgi:hypothetical protein